MQSLLRRERDRLVSSFNDMLCAPTSQLFEEAHAEFLRYASEDARIYFEKDWAKIPEMWARHLCDTMLTAGNNTINRVESHNGKLKNILSSHEKLPCALYSTFQIQCCMRQNTRQPSCRHANFIPTMHLEMLKKCASRSSPHTLVRW